MDSLAVDHRYWSSVGKVVMKLGRVVCSKFWAPLVLVLGLVTPVKAQPAAVSAPAANPLSPTNLVAGPSLYETGKIGVVPESAPGADAGSGRAAVGGQQREVDQAGGGRHRRRAAPPAAGRDHQSGEAAPGDPADFETIENCRVDVARAKRVALSKVVADQLLLRWTIEPSGLVGATEVVAATPVDLDLMDCVKAAMSRWSFTRPRGGAVHVERPFTFRRVP